MEENHEASVHDLMEQNKLHEEEKQGMLKNLQEKLLALEEKYQNFDVFSGKMTKGDQSKTHIGSILE